MSVNVVAVPLTTAICTKFVHPDPRQRSMRTSIWPTAVLVQSSRTARRDTAVAVRPVGADGSAGALTTTDVVAAFERPPLSVTVSVTV